MIEFYINSGSVNPVLRMELILDGRYDYRKSFIHNAIQDSIVTFSMFDQETNIPKIVDAPANIKLADEDGCEEKYILEYEWNSRDTKYKGIYSARFEIKFNGNIKQEGVEYPTGNLIVPIQEDLTIYIK